MTATDLPADAPLDEEARELMVRLADLGPLYDYEVPLAAISLDMAIDGGKLGLAMGENEATLVTLDELAARFRVQGGADRAGELRQCFHRLHAVGAMLVEIHQDIPFLRVVAGRPNRPGEAWIFDGTPESGNVPSTCIPNVAQERLSVDELGALMYMRTCKANLEEPDPEEYGLFDGVDGTERARALFAEVDATGLVDHQGCEACPAAHLCTREDRTTEP
ncbi:hypothetical protein AB0I82_33885 [Streptomyces sp. NPDC050315]|uniref:hypothetical protein n=1 Tax=Streptomyces sp. NPDC050315 TaxID=3155039 RepID=UPI003416F5C9